MNLIKKAPDSEPKSLRQSFHRLTEIRFVAVLILSYLEY